MANNLNLNCVKQGIQHFPNKDAEITYTMFNMQDPIVGGFGLEKVALRRAISLAYNQAEAIKQLV